MGRLLLLLCVELVLCDTTAPLRSVHKRNFVRNVNEKLKSMQHSNPVLLSEPGYHWCPEWSGDSWCPEGFLCGDGNNGCDHGRCCNDDPNVISCPTVHSEYESTLTPCSGNSSDPVTGEYHCCQIVNICGDGTSCTNCPKGHCCNFTPSDVPETCGYREPELLQPCPDGVSDACCNAPHGWDIQENAIVDEAYGDYYAANGDCWDGKETNIQGDLININCNSALGSYEYICSHEGGSMCALTLNLLFDDDTVLDFTFYHCVALECDNDTDEDMIEQYLAQQFINTLDANSYDGIDLIVDCAAIPLDDSQHCVQEVCECPEDGDSTSEPTNTVIPTSATIPTDTAATNTAPTLAVTPTNAVTSVATAISTSAVIPTSTAPLTIAVIPTTIPVDVSTGKPTECVECKECEECEQCGQCDCEDCEKAEECEQCEGCEDCEEAVEGAIEELMEWATDELWTEDQSPTEWPSYGLWEACEECDICQQFVECESQTDCDESKICGTSAEPIGVSSESESAEPLGETSEGFDSESVHGQLFQANSEDVGFDNKAIVTMHFGRDFSDFDFDAAAVADILKEELVGELDYTEISILAILEGSIIAIVEILPPKYAVEGDKSLEDVMEEFDTHVRENMWKGDNNFELLNKVSDASCVGGCAGEKKNASSDAILIGFIVVIIVFSFLFCFMYFRCVRAKRGHVRMVEEISMTS